MISISRSVRYEDGKATVMLFVGQVCFHAQTREVNTCKAFLCKQMWSLYLSCYQTCGGGLNVGNCDGLT